MGNQPATACTSDLRQGPLIQVQPQDMPDATSSPVASPDSEICFQLEPLISPCVPKDRDHSEEQSDEETTEETTKEGTGLEQRDVAVIVGVVMLASGMVVLTVLTGG